MKQTQKQNLTKRPRHPEHVLTIQNTDDQIPSVVTNSSAVPTSHNGVVVVVQPDQVPSQVQSPPLDENVTGDNEEKDCAEVTKAVVGDEQTPLGVENMGGNTNNTTKPEMENNDNETNTQYEVKSDCVEDEKKIESLETPKEMEEQQQPETDQDGETNANDAEHPVDDQQGSAIHQEDSFDSDDEFPLIIPEGEILERTEEQLEDYDEIFEENYEDIYPSTLISSANMPTDDDKAFEEYINRLLDDQKIDFITSVIDDADPEIFDPSNEPLIDDSENADLDEFVSAHEKLLSALIAS